LWSLPDVLVIHLKRFSASSSGMRDKISDLVDFPIDGLDLTPRAIERQVAEELSAQPHGLEALGEHALDTEPLVYDLFAVDNHFGGLGGVRRTLRF
jgi:ubiquitin carboxyl-terminal hydrolase 4/11/15